MALLVSATASEGTQVPGANYVRRLRLQAQLEHLNAELLSQDSATSVLQALCDRRDPRAPKVQARRLPTPEDVAAANAARRQLGAAADAPIRRRRVHLVCGEALLSRADNWYLPARLTEDMNAGLESTDTPFGVVVRPLAFQRRTLSARRLFSPLPPGWETCDAGAFDHPVSIPDDVLEHRALLQTPDGRPFSLLVEIYTATVLAGSG